MNNLNERNPIIKRKYYKVKIELKSPLAVSSGEDYYSDADLLRGGDGKVFIPGTSIAGALRNYLYNKENDKYKEFFGYSIKPKYFNNPNADPNLNDNKDIEQGLMSAVTISDLYFEENKEDEKENKLRISLRDRVKLKDNKTVDNKYDQEIIETGATGIFYLEYVVREKWKGADFDGFIKMLFRGMQSGEIRFGSDKNRGFGRVYILDVKEKKFEKKDVDGWLKFQKASWKGIEKGNNEDSAGEENRETTKTIIPKEADQYVHITVPLKQKGGISIRTYSAKPGDPDYAHITCNGEPVIPGSSWNGAIRAAAKRILQDAGFKEANAVIDDWFGIVRQKQKGEAKQKASQSLIVVGESVLEGGRWLPMSRNKISRFDASTVNGALYSEKSYVEGKTKLELMVKKDSDGNHKAIVGLLYLVIQDLQKGYLAVGGQTAIGRGIFEKDGEIDCRELTENDCLKELGSYKRYLEEVKKDEI